MQAGQALEADLLYKKTHSSSRSLTGEYCHIHITLNRTPSQAKVKNVGSFWLECFKKLSMGCGQ